MLSDGDGADLRMDSLPAKRKSLKPMRHADSLGGDPAGGRSPPRAQCASVGPQQRGACGPACSSPALGAWSERDSAASAAGGEEGDSRRSGELSRAKVQRRKVCAPAAAAAPGACDAVCDAAAGLQAGPFAAAAATTPAGRSLPPSMYRSYHLGCCSRLSSSSSLTEVDAAAVAAAAQAAQEAGLADPPPAAVAAAAAACCDAAAAARRQHGGQLACGCGACAPVRARVSCGLSVRGLALCPHRQRQHSAEAAAAEASLWADMPDDILKRVLERLAPSMLRVLRLVCRSWEAAASRQLRHLRPEALQGTSLARRFPGLHSLDLSNAAAGVDFASPRMLRLQSRLRDEHLAELAGLSRLEQLSLRGCSRLTGLGLAQLAPLGRSLTMLNLSGCSGITDQCLPVLTVAVPRLATLNLQGCSGVGDAGVAALAALPALRHALLPGGITDGALAALAAMPALERVALRGCPRVTTAGIYALLQRRGLKRVVISKCPQVTLEGLCGETHLRVVASAGLPAAAAPAPALAVAPVLPGGTAAAAAALAGQDMQLLIADMH